MERPIIFNNEMVTAILSGRKTQTRRIAKTENCPYGFPGDFLWVRETWAVHILSHEKPSDLYRPQKVWYRGDEPPPDRGKWRPSIFMPRWASRLTLKITAVRAEPLCAITEEDARAEGVTPIPFASGFDDNELHKVSFFQMWDSINAGRGYSVKSNPFVWVIEFDVITNSRNEEY